MRINFRQNIRIFYDKILILCVCVRSLIKEDTCLPYEDFDVFFKIICIEISNVIVYFFQAFQN